MSGSKPPSFTIRSLLSAAWMPSVSCTVLEAGDMGVVKRTVNGQVTKRSASSTLYLGVLTAEEEEDGIEGIPAHGAHLLLSNFCKCECSTALKVDIVGKR